MKVGCLMYSPEMILGNPSKIEEPSVWHWLTRSKIAAVAWTAMRVWLGIMWLQAGVSKLWGAENSAFMHNGGSGVVGFALHGTAAYSWWGHFLHGFVVPNAGWIGVLVAVSEFAIGICLALGLLTPIALLGSLVLLFTYVMSGTASVCAFYALFAVVLLMMWRTAGWIGADGVLSGFRQRHMKMMVDDAMSSVAPVATIEVTLRTDGDGNAPSTTVKKAPAAKKASATKEVPAATK
jgi:thiosulfate dehydrogenase [quinone] large subunit